MSNETEAYAMQRAYRETTSLNQAVAQVKESHPDAPRDILEAMWWAIDAYEDMQSVYPDR